MASEFDYGALVKELREKGPECFYLLWGEEDYLRESFTSELKKAVLTGGFDEFNYKRMSMPSLDLAELSRALDAMPFMGGGTFIELRDFDVNKCKGDDAKALEKLVTELPEYCCLAIVLPTGYEPDGRLSLFKELKKAGAAVNFTQQGQGSLYRWISRRFASYGKTIGRAEAEQLIFVSGSLMSGLIPEIEKLASYAKGEAVTMRDIDEVATRLPEAKVYYMTDHIAGGRYDKAAEVMAELLDMKEHPIMLTAVIGSQLRKLLSARIALDENLGWKYVAELWGIKRDFLAKKLMDSARRFTREQLSRAVILCAETDFKMKSSGLGGEELLRDLLLGLAVGGGR